MWCCIQFIYSLWTSLVLLQLLAKKKKKDNLFCQINAKWYEEHRTVSFLINVMVILTCFADFLHGISIHSEKQKPNPNKLIDTILIWNSEDTQIMEKISQSKTKVQNVCICTVPCKSMYTRCGKELDAVSFCCDIMTGLLADVNWHYSTAIFLAPCWLTSAHDLPLNH